MKFFLKTKKFIFTPPIIIGLFLLLGAGVTLGTIYLGGSGRTDEINLQKGLVGHWTLDGNAKDSTPYNNHGTIYGASSTADRKGQSGKALSFDGVDDYVEVPDSATLFKDGFESGDLTAWDWTEIDGGDLSAQTAAKLHGSYGASLVLDDTTQIIVEEDTPSDEKIFRVRFYIDFNALSMVGGDCLSLLRLGQDSAYGSAEMVLIYDGASIYRIYFGIVEDDSSWEGINKYGITDTVHYIEVYWKAATAPGANNGYLEWWLDGTSIGTITDADNDTRQVDYILFGDFSIEGTPTGTFFLDDFASNNDGSVIGPVGSASLDITNAITVEGWAKKNSQTILFKDGFETGNLSKWTWAETDYGDLSAHADAKMHGNYGLKFVIDDTNEIHVQDTTPNSEKRYRARFYIDPNSLTMTEGAIIIFQALDKANGYTFQFRLAYGADSRYYITFYDRADDAWVGSNWHTITDAPHCIEIDWKASSAPGANDGFLTLWIDGVLKQTLANVDSDTESVGNAFLMAAEVAATFSGTFYMDDFASNNTGTLIGPVGYLASKGENAYALKLDEDGSNLRGDINNTEISASVSNPTEWHHYALTYDGSNQKLYIDGILATTTSKTGSINTNSTNLRIGEYFNGFIDEVHIYNRALSAGEIKALYESYDPALRISDLQKGLVGNWTLDGNAKDSTPYNNHGTIYEASSTTDRKGKANGALSFDGSNDYVSVPHSASINLTGNFTIGFWVKTNSLAVEQGLLYKYLGAVESYRFYWSTDKKITFRSGGGYTQSGALTTGTWYHIVGVFDGTNDALYIDGVFATSSPVSAPTTTTANLLIGSDIWGREINGSMDEVRIYNRALSTEEIKALYESYDPAPRISDLQKGLVGYWTLDGNAKDSTPYGNNGTIYEASSTADRKGQSGKALSFDGLNDYIVKSSFSGANLSQGSVSMWFRINELDNVFRYLFSFDSGDSFVGRHGRHDYENDKLTFCLIENKWTAWNCVDSSQAITANEWHHAVFWWDETHHRVYLDNIAGDLMDSPVRDYDMDNLYVGSREDLGGAPSPWVDFWNGFIDEVRIYNRALSADEIKQLYESYQ